MTGVLFTCAGQRVDVLTAFRNAGARTLIAVAHGASATGDEPSLVGTRSDGSPWSAGQEHWSRRDLGDGWVRYSTMVRGGDGPVAPSVTDPRSAVDFTSPMTARSALSARAHVS